MKYNEAIDMILDGGMAKCRRWINPHYFIKFSDSGHLAKTCSCSQCGDVNFMFSKIDINGDWIVEKDGVIYAEYPGRAILREMIVGGWKRNIPDRFIKVTLYAPPVELFKIPMTQSGYKKLDTLLESGNLLIDERGTPLERVRGVKMLKSRTHEQDEPAELEEGGEPWGIMTTEEMREALESQFPPKPIIADKVNEDWLEKKMLCVIRREHFARFNHTTTSFPTAKCNYPKCPFCFPEPKPDHIPDVSNMVDEPREKVTVQELIKEIEFFANSDRRDREWERIRSLRSKLEYLVSLQEK